jgi:hypothetical protein
VGTLSSLTGGGGLSGSGGAATGTAGDSKGGTVGGSRGLSAPVIFGGFKSDGGATVGTKGQTLLIGLGIVAAGVVLYLLFKRK